ncbi:MAG TPA: PH domain-containing protein [Gammaproteobacteria bacterium]|nr:PH domain-containing protein [Gammaproteobacteria bacterium]
MGVYVLTIVAIGVIANCLGWWLLRGAVAGRRVGQVGRRQAILRYGDRVLAVSIALLLAVGVLLLVIMMAPEQVGSAGATEVLQPLVGALLVASGLLILEARHRRIFVSDAAIVSSGLLGSTTLTWSEIDVIRFNPFTRMLVIRARDGRRLTVNPSLSGMDFLEYLARENLGAGQYARAFHALHQYRP